jgi:uncharacterized protein (UPF0333 family)
MNLKKDLKSKKGQAVLEYILIFTFLVSGVFIVFGDFKPGNLGIKSAFSNAIDQAVTYINRG